LGIGGILQALIAIPALRAARGQLRTNLPLIGLGAAAVAIYPLAFYSSMHLAGVAIGTVVSLASAPLASGVLERIVQRTPLSRWWILAAALGITGSTLLCLSKMTHATGQTGPTVAGIALGLIAGATYAAYSWVAHRLMSHGISRAASMGAVFGAGGTLLLPVLLLTGAPLIATPQAFTVAAYMALIPMFLGYLFFGYGLTCATASTATTIGWIGLGIIALVLAVLAIAPTNAPTPELKVAPRSTEREVATN
jgi:drug/metabolite transporter, DME family